MTLAMVDSSSGAASAAAMKPATVSGVAGRMSMPPTTWPTSCETELEAGRDAEVAAAAADGPEQIRVRLGVDAQERAVRGHDLSRQQAVDGQAVACAQVADAATQGDAADADRARVPEPGGESMGIDRRRGFAGGEACLRPMPFGRRRRCR